MTKEELQSLVEIEKAAFEAYRQAQENLADGQYQYAKTIISEVTEYSKIRWGDNFLYARPVLQDWFPDGGGPEGFVSVVLKTRQFDYWDGENFLVSIQVTDKENDECLYREIKSII